jgi:hypothetical protein
MFRTLSGSVGDPGTYVRSVNGQYTRLPEDLVAIGADDSTIALNPIRVEREQDFGIMKGQSSLFTVTNSNFLNKTYDLPGAWCAIQAGFADLGYWETIAQGKIKSAAADTSLKLTCTLHDSIIDLLNSELPRDIFFTGSNGWIGHVQAQTVGDTQLAKYDNGTASTTTSTGTSANTIAAQHMIDEQYKFVFTSATDFNIYYEDGTPVQWKMNAAFPRTPIGVKVDAGVGWTISEDVCIGPRTSPQDGTIVIKNEGWNGTYAAGDEFIVATAYARTVQERTPVGIAANIITGITKLSMYDVVSGSVYDTILYEEDKWNAYIASQNTDSQHLTGFWKRGTNVIKMIQEALLVGHGSIYPTNTGKLAVMSITGTSTGETVFNGEFGDEAVTIIDAKVDDNYADYASTVTFNYKDETADEEVRTYVKSLEVKSHITAQKTIKTGWRISDITAGIVASRYLVRFGVPNKEFTVNTTIANAAVDITEAVLLEEPFLQTAEKFDVTKKAFDVMGQKITWVGWVDPLSLVNVAHVDVTLVGSTTERVW